MDRKADKNLQKTASKNNAKDPRTEEKRLARNTEALLRISTALPAYPDLEKLLDYISDEVKGLLNVDAVQVMLLDEEKKEFFFKGAAYDRTTAQKEVKEIRFPADKGLAGKVVKTGEAIVVHDTAKAPGFHPIRDEKLGFHTRNLIDVPLKSADRIIGVLSALNKKEGKFGQRDVELLNTISGTVALSIENARFSDELKAAYKEMKSLNRAKDRVISHLSHELKTPIAVLSSSLHTLEKRLRQVTEESWQPTMERSRRNLNRLVEIQHQAEDIMRDKEYKNYNLLTHLLERCSDELEALVAEQAGEGPLVDRIRERIEDIFRPKESQAFEIQLDHFVRERLEALNDQFLQRKIELITRLEPAPRFCIPRDVTRKIADGLIRNAIENTPDGGRIEVVVHKKSAGTELMVRDYGVGITAENQARIFEGFFPTQDAIEYATRRPFDFNAGGKGADLLRMKIFAERYNFTIEMNTSRCRFIPLDTDRCPGKIIACGFCREKGDCLQSGGSSFCVFFPSKLQKKRTANLKKQSGPTWNQLYEITT